MLLMARAATAALMVTYVATLHDLTQIARSNAREFAISLAAKTQPSDLVIVAPEWMASSFNRYYEPSVEQIDYPHPGREGAVDFADLLKRLRDRQGFARVQRVILEARRGGRRIWLIMNRSDVFEMSRANTDRFLNSRESAFAAVARANQIRAELLSRYGPPDTTLVASGPRTRYEYFRAFLFTPAG
jgi:hypothetical protein